MPPTPELERMSIVGAGRRIIDLTTLLPDEVAALSAPRCIACRAVVEIIDHPAGGVSAQHVEVPVCTHDPPTRWHRTSQRLVGAHLATLFPSAQIAADQAFPDAHYLADLLLVSPKGAKMAVEIQTTPRTGASVRATHAALATCGVALVWLVAAPLVMPRRPLKGMVGKLTLGEDMTAVIAERGSICALSLEGHEFLVIRPHPAAVRLAQLGEPRLGVCECLVRRYTLSQLRIRAGALEVPSDFDRSAPAPGPLSKRLAERLARREAALGGQGRLVT